MEEENIMKILVASDIHLGYMERDNTLEKDSFNTFEEVFKIAKDRNADFVLLGGDLFHENKPSRPTLHSCMEIMKRYCLGSRPCQVVTTVNYEDPNINISMPVFSIHGNHDDPAGAGSISAIDLLSVAGYLNHFGRTTNLEKIDITPVLLQKGVTKIALYGLGNIRDERLHRMFLKKAVNFLRPKEDTNEWFNIMAIHQNRAKHGLKNYIPEEFLEKFLDLVIWGHEHECIGSAEWNTSQEFFVLQPGSTVATSLSPGESKKKHVVLLEIYKRKMKSEFIELKTVRNMYVEDIILKTVRNIPDPSVPTIEKDIQEYCEEKVELLIERSAQEMTGHPKQPDQPLIRLRVDYSGGYPLFRANRLASRFIGRVANPESIIHFLKKSATRVKTEQGDMKGFDEMVVPDTAQRVKLEDFVQEYLLKENCLSVLSARGLSHAVHEFVIKQEKDAIYDLSNHQLKKTLDHIKKNSPNAVDVRDITQEIERYNEQKRAKHEMSREDGAEDSGDEEYVEAIREKQKRKDDDSDDSSAKISDSEQETANGRKSTRGRGRGVRGGTRGRGRGSKTSKAAIPVESTSAKDGNILDALSVASQRSRKEPKSAIIMEISDTDEDSAQTVKTTISRSKRSTSKRARGVNYDSDENPFSSASSKKKKR